MLGFGKREGRQGVPSVSASSARTDSTENIRTWGFTIASKARCGWQSR